MAWGYYSGRTMLYKGTNMTEPPWVNVTTHIDNWKFPNLQFRDWVGIFGYGWSTFPPQPYPGHKGIDLVGMGEDKLIYSPPFWTKIIDMGYSSSMGNYVILEPSSANNQHVKTYAVFRMMHFEFLNDRISIGQDLEPGGFVGKEGTTGDSDGSHLHFDTFIQGDYVDSFPYVFDIREEGFEGWDTFATTGNWVCELEVVGETVHNERLVAVAKDTESVNKYGLISLNVRDNEIRTQDALDRLASETLETSRQIGFNRSIDINVTDSNLTLLDKIQVDDVPFMDDGEQANVIGINFDLLNPNNDSIILDNSRFNYIGLIGGGKRK